MELAQPRCAVEDASLCFLKPASSVESIISPEPTTRSSFWIVVAVLFASAMKIAIAWNTIGTNDVVTFFRFAASIQNHGLEWTYRHDISFNHPPLTAYFLIGIYKLAHLPLLEQNGVTFPFLLRLPGIIADVVTAWAVFQIAQLRGSNLPTWALLVFVLSPVSLMITGFHGNTDPVMVAFLTLAALAAVRGNPILCGLFLALSVQVKIIPLLLLPIFFFYWGARRRAFKFLCPMLLASVALWTQPLFNFPVVFAKNVLSYGSFWGLWGVTYWLRMTNWPEVARVTYHQFTLTENILGIILKLLIVAAVLLLAWRRRRLMNQGLLRSIAYAWLVFFIFSPGVCVQYVVWLAPFVLFLSPAFYGWLTAASALFVFFFYNITANGFPWYIAVSTNKLNTVWTPWSLWPWGALIAGLFYFWRRAIETDPMLRLFSVETLPAKKSD